MFLLDYFRRLPYWAQGQVLTFVALAVIGAWLKFDWTVALMLLAGLVVIALLVGLYLFLVRLYRDRQANAFTGEMGQLNTATPRGINDPAKQARLDDLRRNFTNGLAKFRAIGKDFYQLPWYVIVGEPGAGKTEAVRHSGVGFPPGMQDELQGVGGTINMNWWFTNQAVILDTAGRLMFEEVEPGTTNEWKEFLGLLKKYRPNCPVNGLFLALPADSLIRESQAEIERKAGRIARQLEVIERQFDVRFPVFVIITKCDLLNGFRDFFESIDDPTAQNQMIGWSNPDPLDSPFRPELIDQHIETALGRLRRRRLALLQDPAALAGPQARRLDEVDRLYALPQSLALMAPRLRRYLEIIFTANEWSAKPLFLRGIYFTSSLREGSALDQELAEAIGVPVDNLPEGRAWEREGTYFLRDVFVEKAFQEKGLVTRASDTKQLLRKRQALVFGAGFLAVALLALFSILGQRELQNSVARQGGYWLRAAEGWQPKDETWEPLVASDGTKTGFTGDQPVGPGERSTTHTLFHNGTEDRTQFHMDLRDLTSLPISVSWVFRPLTGFGVGIDSDRRRAQRVVFEGSAVKPLLDASRERMISNTPPGMPAEENAALLALVRVEAAGAKHVAVDTDGGEGWNTRFFTPLLAYTAGKVAPDDPRALAAVAAFTYSSNGSRESWAPDWLGGGENLSTNKPISAGIDRLATRAHDAVKNEAAKLAQLAELADLAKQYRDKENELFTVVTSRQPVEKIDPQVLAITGVRADLAAPTGTLKDTKTQLDHKLADLAAMPGFFEKGMGLRAAYERSAAELKGDIDQIKALIAECEPFAPTTKMAENAKGILRGQQAQIAAAALGAYDKSGRHPLFTSIAERLVPLLPELEEAFAQAAPNDATLALWKDLDTNFLDDYGDGRRLYAWRWDAYEGADTIAPRSGYAMNQQLVGSEWKPLQAIFQKVGDLRAAMQAYKRGLREKLIAITNYNYMRVEQFHSQQFPLAYLAQVKAKVKDTLHYPLVYPPGSDSEALNPVVLRNAGLLARQIDADLKSPVYTSLQRNPGRDTLNAFAQKLAGWEMVAMALTTAEGKPTEVNVSLVSGNTQRQMGAPPTTFTIWPAIEMRDGDYRHGSRPSGAEVKGRTRTDAAGDVQLGRFPVDAAFHFHAFHTMNEPHVEVPCGDNYSAIRLINGIYGSAQPDGQSWLASVRLSGTEAVWVRLQFARPLPAVREWPTKYGLELED